jgi:hypothetical protein
VHLFGFFKSNVAQIHKVKSRVYLLLRDRLIIEQQYIAAFTSPFANFKPQLQPQNSRSHSKNAEGLNLNSYHGHGPKIFNRACSPVHQAGPNKCALKAEAIANQDF